MSRAVGDFSEQSPLTDRVRGFNFMTSLAPGDSINTAIPPVWTCTTAIGSDPDAAGRLIGSPQIQGSVTLQRVGGLVAGVTYILAAVVQTIGDDTLDLWAYLPCEAVGC